MILAPLFDTATLGCAARDHSAAWTYSLPHDWEKVGGEDFSMRPGWFTVNPDTNEPPAPPDAATLYRNAASKGEKHLRPKKLTKALHSWMEKCHTPYPTLEEKRMAAVALQIPLSQVTSFCNNYRKRYFKVGNKLTSYSAQLHELASSQ